MRYRLAVSLFLVLAILGPFVVSGSFASASADSVRIYVCEVTHNNAPVIAGQQGHGRLLCRCSSGTQVMAFGQTGSYYAIKMTDESFGYIRKRDVRRLYATDLSHLPRLNKATAKE